MDLSIFLLFIFYISILVKQLCLARNVTILNLFILFYFFLGVPTRSSVAEVRIFPPENSARVMTFIVPGINPDKRALQEMLSVLTAGRVSIQSIRPYYAGVPIQGGTRDLAVGYPDTDK